MHRGQSIDVRIWKEFILQHIKVPTMTLTVVCDCQQSVDLQRYKINDSVLF